MRRTCARPQRQRVTLVATLILSIAPFISTQTPWPAYNACSDGSSSFCQGGHLNRVLAVASGCQHHAGGQDPIRLWISPTWASFNVSELEADQSEDGSAACELAGQLRQYFKLQQVPVVLDETTEGGPLTADNSSRSSGGGGAAGAGRLQGYAGWVVRPDTAAAVAGSAQELPNALLLQDPDLAWSDVLPAVRHLGALYGGRLRALPYAVEVPLLLYRRDVLDSVGARPADTWTGLVSLLTQLRQRQAAQAYGDAPASGDIAGNGTSIASASSGPSGRGVPLAGFCNALPPGCRRDPDLLISIWASSSLAGVSVPTSRSELEELVSRQLRSGNAERTLEGVLRVYRSLMGLAPAAAGHGPCRRPRLDLALQQCAVMVGAGSTIKAALWRLGRERNQLLQRQWWRRRLQLGEGLLSEDGAGASAQRVLDKSVVASGSVALTTPLPGSVSATACGGGQQADACADGGAGPGVLARAMYLGFDVLSYQVNASAPLEHQYAAWKGGAVALGRASRWEAVLPPIEGGATVMRESQLADLEMWTSYGYDASDIAAYLAAVRQSLTSRRAFTAPRLAPGVGDRFHGIVAYAANEAAFGSRDIATLAQLTLANLSAVYDANRQLLLDAFASQLGLELEPPEESDTQPSDSNGGLSAGAVVGLVVSCVVGAAALAGLTWVWLIRRTAVVGDERSKQQLLDRTSAAPGYGSDTTLMLTDVQDSTRLWESLPAVVMDAALSLHNDAFRQLLPRYRGYECHTEGDSFVLAFHTAVEAAAFALEIQLVLLQLNWPQELLDDELCAIVRQVPPVSDSNDGMQSLLASSAVPLQGGGNADDCPGGQMSTLDDANMPSCGGGGSSTLLRGPSDYDGGSVVVMEPWGLQAVDEEQAATCSSEERLIKSLYKRQERGSTSRRPVGRSRTFSTLQGLRQPERSSWSAGLRRQVRKTDMPLGASDPWVEHRSLSENRAEPGASGSARGVAAIALNRGADAEAEAEAVAAAVAAASTVDATEHASVQRLRRRQQQQLQEEQHQHQHQHQRVSAGGRADNRSTGQRPSLEMVSEDGFGGAHAAALLDGLLLRPYGSFRTAAPLVPRSDGRFGHAHAHAGAWGPGSNSTVPAGVLNGAPTAAASTAAAPTAAASTAAAPTASLAGAPGYALSLPLPLQLAARSSLSGFSGEVAEEASLRLRLHDTQQQSPTAWDPPGTRAASQELGSRQLWRRSTGVSVNSNNGNSKSLCLGRARASTRSSAGTTPPFTGLLATLRVSGNGEAEGGGASGGGVDAGVGGGTAGGLIGGVDFLLRAALASAVGRRRPSQAEDDGQPASARDGSRDSFDRRVAPLSLRRFRRRSSASSGVSAGGGLGSHDAPLIFVGDPHDQRRRRRRAPPVSRASAEYDADHDSAASNSGSGGGGGGRDKESEAPTDPGLTTWSLPSSPDDGEHPAGLRGHLCGAFGVSSMAMNILLPPPPLPSVDSAAAGLDGSRLEVADGLTAHAAVLPGVVLRDAWPLQSALRGVAAAEANADACRAPPRGIGNGGGGGADGNCSRNGGGADGNCSKNGGGAGGHCSKKGGGADGHCSKNGGGADGHCSKNGGGADGHCSKNGGALEGAAELAVTAVAAPRALSPDAVARAWLLTPSRAALDVDSAGVSDDAEQDGTHGLRTPSSPEEQQPPLCHPYAQLHSHPRLQGYGQDDQHGEGLAVAAAGGAATEKAGSLSSLVGVVTAGSLVQVGGVASNIGSASLLREGAGVGAGAGCSQGPTLEGDAPTAGLRAGGEHGVADRVDVSQGASGGGRSGAAARRPGDSSLPFTADGAVRFASSSHDISSWLCAQPAAVAASGPFRQLTGSARKARCRGPLGSELTLAASSQPAEESAIAAGAAEGAINGGKCLEPEHVGSLCDDVTFPSVLSSTSGAPSGALLPARRGIAGTVRRTWSELCVATAGSSLGSLWAGGSPVLHTIRRTVGRSASTSYIGVREPPGAGTAAVAASTYGVAFAAGRAAQPPAPSAVPNLLIRRQRAMAEYVQSPLSRQGLTEQSPMSTGLPSETAMRELRLGASITVARKGCPGLGPRPPGVDLSSPLMLQVYQLQGPAPGYQAQDGVPPPPLLATSHWVGGAEVPPAERLSHDVAGRSIGPIGSMEVMRLRLRQTALGVPEVENLKRSSRRASKTYSEPGNKALETLAGQQLPVPLKALLPPPITAGVNGREGLGKPNRSHPDMMGPAAAGVGVGHTTQYGRQRSDPLLDLPPTERLPLVSGAANSVRFRGSTTGLPQALPGGTISALLPEVGAATRYAISSVSGTGVAPRRWPPLRAATPPARLPTYGIPSLQRGTCGSSHGHGYGTASGAGGVGVSTGHDSGRIWGGLEALMEAYGLPGQRGPTGGQVHGARVRGFASLSSMQSVHPAVESGVGVSCDSRALHDVRSSDSRGIQGLYDSTALQGMIELAHGSNGTAPQRDSSALPLMGTSRDAASLGRDSNTSRLITALGSALRSKRISRGGASLGTVMGGGGDAFNNCHSKRIPALSMGRDSGVAARGDGIASGGSGGPSTFMEAMLQYATGAAGHHASSSSLLSPQAGGSGACGTFRRTVSPLSLLNGANAAGSSAGGEPAAAAVAAGFSGRSAARLHRLVVSGGRESDASGTATANSVDPISTNGMHPHVAKLTALALAGGGSNRTLASTSQSHTPSTPALSHGTALAYGGGSNGGGGGTGFNSKVSSGGATPGGTGGGPSAGLGVDSPIGTAAGGGGCMYPNFNPGAQVAQRSSLSRLPFNVVHQLAAMEGYGSGSGNDSDPAAPAPRRGPALHGPRRGAGTRGIVGCTNSGGLSGNAAGAGTLRRYVSTSSAAAMREGCTVRMSAPGDWHQAETLRGRTLGSFVLSPRPSSPRLGVAYSRAFRDMPRPAVATPGDAAGSLPPCTAVAALGSRPEAEGLAAAGSAALRSGIARSKSGEHAAAATHVAAAIKRGGDGGGVEIGSATQSAARRRLSGALTPSLRTAEESESEASLRTLGDDTVLLYRAPAEAPAEATLSGAAEEAAGALHPAAGGVPTPTVAQGPHAPRGAQASRALRAQIAPAPFTVSELCDSAGAATGHVPAVSHAGAVAVSGLSEPRVADGRFSWQGPGRNAVPPVLLLTRGSGPKAAHSAELRRKPWTLQAVAAARGDLQPAAGSRSTIGASEGLVGRAVRLSLQALRNLGSSAATAHPPAGRGSLAGVSAAATATAAAAAAVAPCPLHRSASGTGAISGILESFDEGSQWAAPSGAHQLSTTGAPSALRLMTTSASITASALEVATATSVSIPAAMRPASYVAPQRGSRNGLGPVSQQHLGFGAFLMQRVSSAGGRSSGGAGPPLEGYGVTTSNTQDLNSLPSVTQQEPPRDSAGMEAADDPEAQLSINPAAGAATSLTGAEILPRSAAGVASGMSASVPRTALSLAAPSPLLVAVMSASASGGVAAAAMSGSPSVAGGGGAGGGSKPAVSSGPSGVRRAVKRNPTPERLMAGIARRLDSIVSHAGGSDMPAWDAAAREGLKSRQTSGATSLVGRLGVGVVQRIAPGSKKTLGAQGAAMDSVCFRGFRVRCGMHSGLEEGRDVYWTKVCGRRAYSGPAMALAKTVSDLVPGGMVILSHTTFDRLQPWPNAEALPGAIIWARGRFRVSIGEANSNLAPLTEVDLYQLLCPQLLPRQPHLERKPWRGADQVLPGVLCAPLGRLALVLVQVAGVQVLSAWNKEVTDASLHIFASVAAEVLPAWGGYPASLDVRSGALLAAFREPALALGFMHALIDVLRDAEWPPELLTHELGEALAVALSPAAGGGTRSTAGGMSPPPDGMTAPLPQPLPLMSMSMSMNGAQGPTAESGFLFRGLRLRCVADVASVRVDLGCATAASLYEARDPKAFKALRRMLAQARMGAVLCSGLLVAEVLSGPPPALAALHELLAFAPLPTAASGSLPPQHRMPPAASLDQQQQALQAAALAVPPLSPLPGGASPHVYGGTTPTGRSGGGFGSRGTGNGMSYGDNGLVPVSARLTGKEASRSTVYQCTRRRPVRRSGMGQAGFALVGSVGGVYGSAATGMYGTVVYGGSGSVNSAGGSVGG